MRIPNPNLAQMFPEDYLKNKLLATDTVANSSETKTQSSSKCKNKQHFMSIIALKGSKKEAILKNGGNLELADGKYEKHKLLCLFPHLKDFLQILAQKQAALIYLYMVIEDNRKQSVFFPFLVQFLLNSLTFRIEFAQTFYKASCKTFSFVISSKIKMVQLIYIYKPNKMHKSFSNVQEK